MPTIRDPLTDRFGGLLNPAPMMGRLFGANPPIPAGIFTGATRSEKGRDELNVARAEAILRKSDLRYVALHGANCLGHVGRRHRLVFASRRV